jgi:hypothetical protein
MQFISIGGGSRASTEPKGKKEIVCLAARGKLGSRSIDLDRFISASLRGDDTWENYCLTVRLRGSGYLRFFKDTYIEVYIIGKEKAQKDYDRLIEAANNWKASKNYVIGQRQAI